MLFRKIFNDKILQTSFITFATLPPIFYLTFKYSNYKIRNNEWNYINSKIINNIINDFEYEQYIYKKYDEKIYYKYHEFSKYMPKYNCLELTNEFYLYGKYYGHINFYRYYDFGDFDDYDEYENFCNFIMKLDQPSSKEHQPSGTINY